MPIRHGVRRLSRRQTGCNAPDTVHLDGRTRVQNRRSGHVLTLGDTAGRGLLTRTPGFQSRSCARTATERRVLDLIADGLIEPGGRSLRAVLDRLDNALVRQSGLLLPPMAGTATRMPIRHGVRCLSRRQTGCNAPDPVHLDGRTRVQNRRSAHVPTLGDTAGSGLLIP
jgi:hypothetical protein